MGKFANGAKAGPSKRRSLKDKYKIQRKVRAHNKKTRRQARKIQALGRKKRLPKEQPLPNLYPFKTQIIQAMKNQKLQQKKKRQLQANIPLTHQQIQQISASKHYSDIDKLIEEADIIIQVLDARDPAASRSEHLQNFIKGNPSKRLILLINKIDLIPLEIAYNWQASFMKEYPTVLFRAVSNHRPNQNLKLEAINEKKPIGISNLMHILQKFKTIGNAKIVVVGYHKVGKCSVIKMISNLKEQVTGQLIKINENLSIFKKSCMSLSVRNQDSIIFQHFTIQNIHNFLQNLINNVSKEHLLTFYKIQDFQSIQDFLEKVAKSTKKMLKGGITDIKKTQKAILADWENGRIPYYITP